MSPAVCLRPGPWPNPPHKAAQGRSVPHGVGEQGRAGRVGPCSLWPMSLKCKDPCEPTSAPDGTSGDRPGSILNWRLRCAAHKSARTVSSSAIPLGPAGRREGGHRCPQRPRETLTASGAERHQTCSTGLQQALSGLQSAGPSRRRWVPSGRSPPATSGSVPAAKSKPSAALSHRGPHTVPGALASTSSALGGSRRCVCWRGLSVCNKIG